MFTKIKIACAVLIATGVLCTEPIDAQAPIQPKVLSVMEIKQLAVIKAKQYNVPYSHIAKIVECESNWNTQATNNTSKEYSVGISQINLKAHKNISEKDARDPNFALDFLASNLANGKAKMWSCSRVL